ncbi:MurR/RpiR family transcriptional regulator [Paenibacillus sp. N3.4]|uniref:MurR/RpiR family transcriptional regulator n=1 Tax=Paenibacillus sp. N3.4 TaxID=2603222 RepID=UPI0011CA8EDA|nr:MurR/RpiR family transcriptional regulator [Paenibacillus sp. N3.4]TXK83608.1 MurR/RpiR family transcriptional regulator [Paenibacillus sp. N3.4]
MDGGLVRLREILGDITPSEKKIAKYILQHPEQTVQMSVALLAEASGGSPAAIIRLCKSMSVTGFQELKLKVAGDLQGNKAFNYKEIQPDDSIENIINSVSSNNIQSIKDTVKILDVSMISKAVDALQNANRIFFYGIGASNLIAMDAQYKFLRISRMSFSFADPHLQIGSSTSLQENDVAVGISYSGETAQVISCLNYARECNATTISITKWGTNTLSSYADIPLMITSTENEIRSGATSSRITQLNVIDILYLGVASRSYDQSVTHLEKSRKAIREFG